MRRRVWRWTGGSLLAVLLALPLLLGLGEQDLENDEAIYAHVIDHIVAGGDWLRLDNPYGGDFHEKPPLKMWLTAAGMSLGLLPRDERGYRLLEALGGLAALGYVALIGNRLAGPVCGAWAALLLVSRPGLLFHHGLRSGTMESLLVLAYAGGVYHFLGWSGARSRRGAWAHLLAVPAWFAVALLAKFASAALLPAILGLGGLLDRGIRRRLVAERGRWAVGAALALALAFPWFLYARARFGEVYFAVLAGDQVWRRFTAYLEPEHLAPWSYYLEQLRASLGVCLWLALAGLLLWAARRRERPAGAALIAVWLLFPLLVLSALTSKLGHYLYPFLAPAALGAGYAAACLARQAGPALAGLRRTRPRGVRRAALGTLASACLALLAATALRGQVSLELGALSFRSRSLVRPAALLGLGLLGLGAPAAPAAALACLAGLGSSLLRDYKEALVRAAEPVQATRSLAACLERNAPAAPGPFVYLHLPWSLPLLNEPRHYLARFPMLRLPGLDREELRRRLESPGELAVAVVWDQEVESLRGDPAWRELLDGTASAPLYNARLYLPGSYCECLDAAWAVTLEGRIPPPRAAPPAAPSGR